jgi:hypothetical protein
MVKILPTVPQVEHCSHLSRYFGSRDRLNPDICPTTGKYDIPIEEGREGFKRRVREHIQSTEKYNSDEVIWCITHAIVYKRIARHHGIPCPHRIDFLSHFVVEPPKNRNRIRIRIGVQDRLNVRDQDRHNVRDDRLNVRDQDRLNVRDQDRLNVRDQDRLNVRDQDRLNVRDQDRHNVRDQDRYPFGRTNGLGSRKLKKPVVKKPPRDPVYFEMFGTDYVPGRI